MEIYEHKKKLYTMGEPSDQGFVVGKASMLPDGKKLVEETRLLNVKNAVAVKRAICTGKYETYDSI